MICTIGPVGDQNAARLAILLAGELTRTKDSYEAYLRVRPEGGSYRYYKAGGSAPVRSRLRDSDDEMREMVRMVYSLDARSQLLNQRIWFALVGIAISVLLTGVLWLYTASNFQQLRQWQANHIPERTPTYLSPYGGVP